MHQQQPGDSYTELENAFQFESILQYKKYVCFAGISHTHNQRLERHLHSTRIETRGISLVIVWLIVFEDQNVGDLLARVAQLPTHDSSSDGNNIRSLDILETSNA